MVVFSVPVSVTLANAPVPVKSNVFELGPELVRMRKYGGGGIMLPREAPCATFRKPPYQSEGGGTNTLQPIIGRTAASVRAS